MNGSAAWETREDSPGVSRFRGAHPKRKKQSQPAPATWPVGEKEFGTRSPNRSANRCSVIRHRALRNINDNGSGTQKSIISAKKNGNILLNYNVPPGDWFDTLPRNAGFSPVTLTGISVWRNKTPLPFAQRASIVGIARNATAPVDSLALLGPVTRAGPRSCPRPPGSWKRG
jgi:hypothetical protein